MGTVPEGGPGAQEPGQGAVVDDIHIKGVPLDTALLVEDHTYGVDVHG